MKFPFTMRLEYSSRKKNGGLREPAGTELSGAPWLSNDIAEDNAGECGIGGTLGSCCEAKSIWGRELCQALTRWRRRTP
ncbi:hypothetical protein HBI56_134290 [Parastagonospora nodorum]|nr:hypothetical protein HBH56_037390 [Parastagonospora nodorum]KAH3952602.1 hypothetical protein HBH53_048040 [Parastagonospora nodorum]KAH3979648.1 hypothetical protein HBH51_059040 [Parastagonospora nodorum]KAH3980184.1 hypothetical protein HBH52_095190 [Parastagonospora nodorum]KAH4032032.1 hypothetical protein HBI13_019150 [Parastagonospora nodorum]